MCDWCQSRDNDFWLLCVCLGDCTMKHAHNLSKTLQSSTISAAEGQKVAALTVATVEGIRTDESFNLFWKLIQKKASDFDVLTTSPMKDTKMIWGRISRALLSTNSWRALSKDYYEVLDFIVASIKKRFDQPGFGTNKNLQNLLIKAANQENFEDEFKTVTDFYGTDIQPSILQVQLETLSQYFSDTTSKVNLLDIISFL